MTDDTNDSPYLLPSQTITLTGGVVSKGRGGMTKDKRQRQNNLFPSKRIFIDWRKVTLRQSTWTILESDNVSLILYKSHKLYQQEYHPHKKELSLQYSSQLTKHKVNSENVANHTEMIKSRFVDTKQFQKPNILESDWETKSNIKSFQSVF